MLKAVDVDYATPHDILVDMTSLGWIRAQPHGFDKLLSISLWFWVRCMMSVGDMLGAAYFYGRYGLVLASTNPVHHILGVTSPSYAHYDPRGFPMPWSPYYWSSHGLIQYL